MEKIRIYKSHTHNGVRYEPGPEGAEIEVDSADAAFLKAQGLSVPVQSVPAAAVGAEMLTQPVATPAAVVQPTPAAPVAAAARKA